MTGGARKPRAIIAHGLWGRGGAEAAAMWVIAALVQAYDVTVYTRGGFDLAALNRIAGTEIPADALTLRIAQVESGLPIGALSAGRFLRSLQKVGAGYDLRVSASGVLPWGRPALHFMSSIEWHPGLVARLHGATPGLRARLSGGITRLAAGPRRDGPQDLFIANSNWLKTQCAPVCPGEIRVIHPVIPLPPMGHPWEGRDTAVLVFGRISPEKRIEACVRIVEQARAKGFGGGLVIAGPDGAPDYAAQIRALAATHDWITLLPAQTGADKDALLGRVRYGLNACLIEAFGISSGEMAAAGAIVLVPAGTGQSDIVTDPSQHFATEGEAAEKLAALSQDAARQQRLQASAHKVRDRFGAARFVAAVQAAAQDLERS